VPKVNFGVLFVFETRFQAFVAVDAIHLFGADHLCATFAVVKVVCNADHAHCADVVGRSSLDGASASHAANNLD
jgi:hypothetical protein